MVISYNTFKYPGAFDKTVTVFTGEGKDESQTVHIVGYVEPVPMGVMEVVPRKTVVSGLEAGKASPAKIVLKNAGDAPMTVTAIKSRKFKTVYWQGEITLAPGESTPVAFVVKPKKQGRFMDIVMVHSDARNDIGKGFKAVLTGTAE